MGNTNIDRRGGAFDVYALKLNDHAHAERLNAILRVHATSINTTRKALTKLSDLMHHNLRLSSEETEALLLEADANGSGEITRRAYSRACVKLFGPESCRKLSQSDTSIRNEPK